MNAPLILRGAASKRLSALHCGALNLVVDGDSNTDLSFGLQTNNWWGQLAAKLTAAGYLDVRADNFAVSGDRWSDHMTRIATVQAAADAQLNGLLLMFGTNDTNSDTGPEILASAQSAVTNHVGSGIWDFIGLLEIPPITPDATRDARVDAYNAGLPSLTGVDFVISRQGITELDVSDDGTYFSDALHFAAAGADLWAEVVLEQLRRRV